MKRAEKKSWAAYVPAMLMVMALLWLTVSTPFLYAAQQVCLESPGDVNENQSENLPFSNNTEEKSESSVSSISEYLHEMHLHDILSSLTVKLYKCHPSDLYFAFHPELISPPPEQLS